MYIPEHFQETDPQRITALIQANPFGMLVTAPAGVPFVTHLPFLFEPAAGVHGRLLGHVARANPQWQHFASGHAVLAVFHGPHAYVSPSWYASPGVPTWNFAAVHVQGIARVIEDKASFATLLEQLTQTHEASMASPWQPDFSGDRHAKMLDAIVGFEIDISDIQAKFKLSQNRSSVDRQSVMNELSLSSNQTENEVAILMSAKEVSI
ncbi:MAG: FMN-binding negative transcriptional regulator [Sulfuriferula sp.]